MIWFAIFALGVSIGVATYCRRVDHLWRVIETRITNLEAPIATELNQAIEWLMPIAELDSGRDGAPAQREPDGGT
jgi:hypothetical protein